MKLSSPKDCIESRRTFLVWLLLAFATLIVYGRVVNFDFTNYDDPFLIYENPVVRAGLTLRGLLWALTTSYFEFWHPLTWLSHMLDYQLFGLRPGLHHLMNLGFHVANALVLFAVLRRMTGALWRSAIVAALFALHPLHVESVAWLSERKDVLSTFFGLLSLWAYARYTGESKVRSLKSKVFYRLALVLFAFGLMTKPMVVTLPFVLLLLDYWPLRRVSSFKLQVSSSSILNPQRSGLSRLILEKLPFFGLALVSCAITFIGVKTAHNILSTEVVPWGFRLANVPVSYVRYLGKMVWPVDLAVFYPMPSHWEAWQVVGAVLLLLLISLLVVVWARSAPYLIFGWLMFLGTLVPTLGLVPVGYQSIADRYTYFPSIGLFVAVVWAVADFSVRWRFRTAFLAGATALALLVCGSVTWFQVRHWRNSITLWTHCLAATRGNATAHYQLGHALQHSGQANEAMKQYREALRIKPDHLDANLNLGVALVETNQLQEATNYFGKALRIEPDYAKAHINMGNALYKLKDFSGATNHYAQALQTNPDNGNTHHVYALALLDLGDFTGAITHASEAMRLDPKDFWAFTFKGRALSALGKSDEALDSYFAALNLNYGCADAHYHLGLEWMKRGRLDEAVSSFGEVLRINPASAGAHFQLAVTLTKRRKTKEALAHYREALRLAPDSPATLNNLAWILATHPDADVRHGAEAVQLAERACERTGYQQTIFIGTLAAAYAEGGQFEKAVETAQRACDLASSLGQTNLFERNQELLRQFKNGKPWREPD